MAPRCGARTRAGKSCRRPPIRGRKRCRLHGGLSPGAPHGPKNGNFKNGDWTAVYDGDGEIAFKYACELGCEGILSKRLGSLHRSGRSAHWAKVKNPKAPALKREAKRIGGAKACARKTRGCA